MILQRTPEWIDVRRGKPTASEMWRLMGGDDAANTFKAEKLAERMCGQLPDRVSRDNPNIMRGIDLEDEAIRAGSRVVGAPDLAPCRVSVGVDGDYPGDRRIS